MIIVLDKTSNFFNIFCEHISIMNLLKVNSKIPITINSKIHILENVNCLNKEPTTIIITIFIIKDLTIL